MHAYLIMAHKNQHQLVRLLKQLDDDGNDIYLHIDKKHFDQFDTKTVIKSCDHSDVYIIKPSNIFWGGYRK